MDKSERLLFIKMIVPKKRGRPKGSRTKRAQPMPESEYDRLRKLMNERIDSQHEWIFENLKRDCRTDRCRRDAIERAVARGEIDVGLWQKEQDSLEELWIKIKEQKKVEEEKMEKECNDAKELVEDGCIEEEEEQSEMIKNSVVHTTRASYLKWKPPLESFDETAIQYLPYDKQVILREHNAEIFNDTITYQEQIKRVLLLIYDPVRGSRSGCQNIARIFGITRGAMQTHITRILDETKNEAIGRPSVLTDEQLVLIYEYVSKKTDGSKSPDLPKLQNWIYKRFNVDITKKTLSQVIKRSPTMKICIGIPMEQVRAEVPIEIIIDHYDKLEKYLEALNIPPAFMFNVDESGFHEFVDAIKTRVVVPIECTEEQVVVSVNRNSKRASMIGCIAADGTALKPMIVTPRKRIALNLKYHGYTDDVCSIVHQESGFVNAAVFDYWATTILFPEITHRRTLYNYQGEALLMLDGCTSHFSDFFLDECTYFNVHPWQEPAGTSDQVQALDLGIFGIQKALKRSIDPPEFLSPDEKEIVAIVDSWKRATTPGNVTSAFRQAGIYQEKLDENYVMRANVKYARAVRGMEHEPAPFPEEYIKTESINAF